MIAEIPRLAERAMAIRFSAARKVLIASIWSGIALPANHASLEALTMKRGPDRTKRRTRSGKTISQQMTVEKGPQPRENTVCRAPGTRVPIEAAMALGQRTA